jgi:hypothetical protein
VHTGDDAVVEPVRAGLTLARDLWGEAAVAVARYVQVDCGRCRSTAACPTNGCGCCPIHGRPDHVCHSPDAGSSPRPAPSRVPPWLPARADRPGRATRPLWDCDRAGSSSANAASTSGGRSGGSRSARSALRGTIRVLVIAWSLPESDDSESGHVTYTADLTRPLSGPQSSLYMSPDQCVLRRFSRSSRRFLVVGRCCCSAVRIAVSASRRWASTASLVPVSVVAARSVWRHCSAPSRRPHR